MTETERQRDTERKRQGETERERKLLHRGKHCQEKVTIFFPIIFFLGQSYPRQKNLPK